MIDSRSRYVENGSGVNPNILQSGVTGRIIVKATIVIVAISRYFPGLLLKKGFWLRMTSTISDAETTDSMNHPVLN